MWACPVFARLGRRIFSGTWSIVYCRRRSGGGNWTTGITMATRGWTWLVLYWLSCSEGERGREGGRRREGVPMYTFLYFRLFRNLTKEVRLYAQKFIDKGRVSE